LMQPWFLWQFLSFGLAKRASPGNDMRR